jgi:hypothetical protein
MCAPLMQRRNDDTIFGNVDGDRWVNVSELCRVAPNAVATAQGHQLEASFLLEDAHTPTNANSLSITDVEGVAHLRARHGWPETSSSLDALP